MDYVDIVNALHRVPFEDLTVLETDIVVLNEFEIETMFGGGTHYFDSSCGDHIELLKDTASRHAFTELLSWLSRVADLIPDLVSVDRNTRSEGLHKLSERTDDPISDDGSKLADDAGALWIKLIENNMAELTAAYDVRNEQ